MNIIHNDDDDRTVFPPEFHEHAGDILGNEFFLSTKNSYSHGTISIYEHSVHVALLAFSLIKNSNTVDRRCVIRAALLHDFFLYEWHVPGFRYLVHGWAHPRIAAEKAREVFNIGDREYSCILTHMWPWTLFRWPKCREGWAVSLADKIVAFKETVLRRGRRRELRDPAAQIQE
jgi:uncharacterized protein